MCFGLVGIRVYPSIGRGSYEVRIDVPDWVRDLDDYIETWMTDDLINVDHWEYIDKWNRK